MKITVSIPDPLFKEAEKAARDLRLSRSKLYARAIEAFLKKQGRKEFRAALKKFCAENDTSLDPVMREVARRTLRRSEWAE